MNDESAAILFILGVVALCGIGFFLGHVNGRNGALICDHRYQQATTAQDSLAVAADGCGWFIQEPSK